MRLGKELLEFALTVKKSIHDLSEIFIGSLYYLIHSMESLLLNKNYISSQKGKETTKIIDSHFQCIFSQQFQ